MIRLVFATVGATASVAFVALYSQVALAVVPSRIEDFHAWNDLIRWLPTYTQWVVHCGFYAVLLPAVLLLVGILALLKWKSEAVLEIAIGCQWLFAFIWATICLFVWMLPEIPAF